MMSVYRWLPRMPRDHRNARANDAFKRSLLLDGEGRVLVQLHPDGAAEISAARPRSVKSVQRPVPLDFEFRTSTLHRSVEELLESGKAPIYLVHFTQKDATEAAQNYLALDPLEGLLQVLPYHFSHQLLEGSLWFPAQLRLCF